VFFGDVVNRVPGVYVNNLGAEQHMASIRQPISTQGVYLYLEDGVPVRPAGLFNHNQVYEVNMGGIGGVEVIKGPASSLYGSYATGGLMNFLTKAPSPVFEASVGVQASDQGYQRVDFGLSGTSESGQHAYRFSGYGFDQSNGWAKHSDADKQAFTFRHDMDLGANRVLKTILTHTDLYSQMGGGINQTQWDNGNLGESPQTFTFRDVTATRLSSSLEAEFNPGGLTTLTGFYRKNETNQVPTFFQTTGIFGGSNPCTNDSSGAPALPGITPGGGAGTRCGRTTDQSFETLGVDVRHRQLLGDQGSKVIVGFIYDQGSTKAKEERYTFSFVSGGPYTNKSSSIDALRDYKASFYNAGIYSQAEIVLKPGLLGVLGARYDTIEYDYTRLGSYGAPSGKTSYSGVSPKAGLVLSPNQNTSYYANVSTGFAPPEISTKFGGSSTGLIDKTTTTSKELGIRTQMLEGRLGLDVAVYELDMENAIYSSETSQTYNADSKHRGLELGVDFKVNKRFEVNSSLALTEQTVRSVQRNNTSATANNIGKDLRYAPETVGNVQLKYRVNGQTEGSLEAQYVGAYWMNEANTVKYDGHTLLHARLTHNVGPWEYWLSARNLQDKQYAEFATRSFGNNSYNPGAPRTVQAGLRYTFGGKAK